MRKKILNLNKSKINEPGLTEWFTLQNTNTLKNTQFKKLDLIEKNWVKEGFCEECGVFDVLTRHNGRFLCSKCLRSITSNNKKEKKTRKRKKKVR